MSTFKELSEQIRVLQQQADEARKLELSGAIAQIKQLMADFGIVASDLPGGHSKAVQKDRAPVAPMYRNPETNATWSGRGKPPGWIKNEDRTKFLIKS